MTDNKRNFDEIDLTLSDDEDDCYEIAPKKQKFVDLMTFPGKLHYLPIYWNVQNEARLDFFHIKENEMLYTQIINMLKLTKLYQVNIVKIQNYDKWDLYQAEKMQFIRRLEEGEIKSIDERWGFHGTKLNNIDSIIKNGFDRSYGRVNQYGLGVYFAKYSEYSLNNRYAEFDKDGWQHLLLCRVILGEKCIGTPNKNIPLKQNGVCYDSMVDNLNDERIYVIPKDNHAFAEFKISLKKINVQESIENISSFNENIQIDSSILFNLPYYPAILRETLLYSSSNSSRINKSKYLGVSKFNNSWHVYINKNKYNYYLGAYINEEEAGSIFSRVYRHLYVNNNNFVHIGSLSSSSSLSLSSSSSSSSLSSSSSSSSSLSSSLAYRKDNYDENIKKALLEDSDDDEKCDCCLNKIYNSRKLSTLPVDIDQERCLLKNRRTRHTTGINYTEYKCINKSCEVILGVCDCGFTLHASKDLNRKYNWYTHCNVLCPLIKKLDDPEIKFNIIIHSTDQTSEIKINKNENVGFLKNKIKSLYPELKDFYILHRSRKLPSINYKLKNCNLPSECNVFVISYNKNKRYKGKKCENMLSLLDYKF